MTWRPPPGPVPAGTTRRQAALWPPGPRWCWRSWAASPSSTTGRPATPRPPGRRPPRRPPRRPRPRTCRASGPSSPASSAARPSGGRRRASATPSCRVLQVPGLPRSSRWPTRSRSRPHRRAWTRCSPRRTSTTGCSPTGLGLRRPVGPAGTGRRRGWQQLNPLGPRASHPTARRCSSGSPGASRSGTCRPTRGAASRPPTTSRSRGPATASLWLPGPGDTGRPDPWHQATTSTRRSSRVRRVPPELDWMEGTGAPTTGGSGPVRQPRVPGRRPRPANPISSRSASGRNKICCAPMGWFSHDFLLFARRPATAPTGCWPGGSARPTSTGSASTPTSRRRLVAASWAEDAFR